MEFVIVGWRLKPKEEQEEGETRISERFKVHFIIPELVNLSEGMIPARISGIPDTEPFLVAFKDLEKIVRAHAVMMEV